MQESDDPTAEEQRHDTLSHLTTLSRMAASAPESLGHLPLHIQRALATAADYFVDRSENSSSTGPSHTLDSLHSASSHAAQVTETPHIARNVQINRVTTLDILYTYPKGATIEYPETSSSGKIGHLLTIDPSNWYNPARDFVYSRGEPSGGSKKRVFVSVLVDQNGVKVPCQRSYKTCQGCKICPHLNPVIIQTSHCAASRDALTCQLDSEYLGEPSLQQALIEKTIAYYGSVMMQGCGGPPFEHTALSGSDGNQLDRWTAYRKTIARGHNLKERCGGKILLDRNPGGSFFLRCEHYSLAGTRDHFIDHEIANGLYDLTYLVALFTGNDQVINNIEFKAAQEGYGPQSPCNTVSNANSIRAACPTFHRTQGGLLELSSMMHLSCSSKFRIFEPLDSYRIACPRVLIICEGAHRHPLPLPSKTPPLIQSELISILNSISRDLPDLTPRRLLRHSVTNAYLRNKFPDERNPTLLDLHPSLANRDHLRSYISKVQAKVFPSGTGWEGVLHMKACQDQDVLQAPYIRTVEELVNFTDDENDGSSGPFRIIICMSPESSHLLLKARFIQSDIGFKRIVGFQEFELGGMDLVSRTSIVYCRIYLNRQSANAHHYIFKKIDEVVHLDTGRTLQWRHLHGKSANDCSVGILQIAADQHGGQAKGLGMYLCDVAQRLKGHYDLHEVNRLLSDLSPYDHLRRVFRLCAVHVMRNIKTCNVSDSVKSLMRSLVCVCHDNWEGTISNIRSAGGKAGADWIDDKLRSKFAFPGMCWERSFIPLQVWQIGDSNSNIIEGLHADVNREGINCTLLGGLMKGQHYDSMKTKTLKTQSEIGIRPSYRHGQLLETVTRKIRRKRQSQHNVLAAQDDKITKRNHLLQSAHQALTRASLRLSQETGKVVPSEALTRKLEGLRSKALLRYQRAVSSSSLLVGTGSGQVPLLLPRR